MDHHGAIDVDVDKAPGRQVVTGEVAGAADEAADDIEWILIDLSCNNEQKLRIQPYYNLFTVQINTVPKHDKADIRASTIDRIGVYK